MNKLFDYIKEKSKFPKGVSLISLVITIIAIIIIATIAIWGNMETIDEATIAKYRNELKGVEVSLAAARIDNQRGGIGEEYKEEGFYPIIIENPPENFASFSEDEFKGYIVDLEYIKEKATLKGYDYKKYKNAFEGKTLIFGAEGKDNDLYVYDSTGKVFYAKGYYATGGVYYSDIMTQDGPIITVTKTYIDLTNVVRVNFTVTSTEEIGELIVELNNNVINDDGTGNYSYTATSNGIITIIAEQNGKKSIKNVHIDEISEGTYIIIYNYRDGVTAQKTQTKIGTEAIRLKTAKRDGYILKGWSRDENAVTAEYLPGGLFTDNADTVLYAVWQEGEAKEYTITFNANGGLNPPDSIMKIQNEAVLLPTQIPNRNGFLFDGWSDKSTSEDGEYAAGTEYTKDGDVVLFAIWKAGDNRVNIIVTPEGAGTTAGAGVRETGSMVYITAAANQGYAFYRWTVQTGNASLENAYAETTRFKMPSGTVSLVANFKSTEYDYVIKYNANNGTGVPNTQYKKVGESINISTTIPRRSGYIFKGWAKQITATEAEYLPGAIYRDDESITLYAVWEKSSQGYTLTFDANGGINAPDKITKVKNTIVTIPLDTPTRGNLAFLGWNLDKDANVATYKKTDLFTITKDETLYAIWLDSEVPIVSIEAKEENEKLVLYGNATDNGEIAGYAWTNQFYSESQRGNIIWTEVTSQAKEISIQKNVIQSGIHCFYVKDKDGNISYSSIDVYKLIYKSLGQAVMTEYKAAGYAATLTTLIPERDMYVFVNWQAESDNRKYGKYDKGYQRTEKYLLDRDEIFNAVWEEAVACIPSTNKYYLATQEAVDKIPNNVSDYVLVRLLKNETTPGVQIIDGQKVSLEMGVNILNCEGTAVTVSGDATFKMLDGRITSANYGVKNSGHTEILTGEITAKYGIANSGSTIIGDENAAFSQNTVKITGTSKSYSKETSGATLQLNNGSLIDVKVAGNAYEIPMAGITTRSEYVIRIRNNATSRITTLTERLVLTPSVLARNSLVPSKVLEVRVTLSCANLNHRIQYSLDNINWITATSVDLLENMTVYGRTLDNEEIATTGQIQINNIDNIFILSFDSNGGSSLSSKTVKYKRPYGTLTVPTRAYTVTYATSIPSQTVESAFNSWHLTEINNNGTEKAVIPETVVTAKQDHTLYANWTNGSITLPTPSERTGYTFDGWYTSATGGTRAGSAGATYTPTSNVTLYEQWTPNVYQITLNNNLATTNGTSTIYEKYETGWYSNSNATTSISAITKPRREYNVSYNYNEGTGSVTSNTAKYRFDGYYSSSWVIDTNGMIVAAPTKFESNTSISARWTEQGVTLPGASRAGHRFDGWYTSSNGGSKIGNAGATYTPNSNVTLYAHWTPNVYQITLSNNLATTNGTSIIYEKYATGWYSDSNATASISTITNPRREYTVSYDYNGGNGSVSSNEANYTFNGYDSNGLVIDIAGRIVAANTKFGANTTINADWTPDDVTLPTPYSRTEYTFDGWYTSSNGGTKIGNAGATYTPTSNVTLYAQWKLNNKVPVIKSVSATSTTSSITISAMATDVDGDAVRYKIYIGTSAGSCILNQTSGYVSQGVAQSYTISGLQMYTTYYYYVIADDGVDSSNASQTLSVRTYCSGATCSNTTYCSGGTSACCSGNKCSVCGHGKHSGTCTVQISGGNKPCELCKKSGTLTCSGEYDRIKESIGKCRICKNSSGEYIYSITYRTYKCKFCPYTYQTASCTGCLFNIPGNCGRDGYVGSVNLVHQVDCPNCDNGYVPSTKACGCTHNGYACAQQASQCTHKQMDSHYYCSNCNINKLNQGQAHCSHGYTSQH